MTALPPCPECAANRHSLCTGQLGLGFTDDWAPCPCRQAGHTDGVMLQHLLSCDGPNVSITNGVYKMLLTCRSCDASVVVEKR